MVFIASDGFDGMKLIRCDDKTVENLTIPAQVSSRAVTTIGSGAFVGCDDLKTVSIPASVKKIDPGAFGTCRNLEKISVSSGNTGLSADDQGILHGKNEYRTLLACPTGSEGRIVIGADVIAVDVKAFSRCGGVQAIEVDEGNPYFESDDQGILYTAGMLLLIMFRRMFGRNRRPVPITAPGSSLFCTACAEEAPCGRVTASADRPSRRLRGSAPKERRTGRP